MANAVSGNNKEASKESKKGNFSPALLKILQQTTKERLVHVLVNVCQESRDVTSLCDALLTTTVVGSDYENDGTVCARFDLCATCGEEYDAGDNSDEEACAIHDGDVEPDYDSDIWEGRYHLRNPKSIKQAWKDGHREAFTWSCCQANCEDWDEEARGCVRDVHYPSHGKGAKEKEPRVNTWVG